eukprot:TRINITY_DN110_c0_g3_i4.p1 TRINITY_DN110_c0_g3~~TRINITY_DN110_c0_g3_i4.p1  ORF type:complete len:238 (+),score=37.42 TRINITY_DN110_c0_g3_i4:233-946(+)
MCPPSVPLILIICLLLTINGHNISHTSKIYSPNSNSDSSFAFSLSPFCDLNGDGRPELLMGDYNSLRGVYVLFLNETGELSDLKTEKDVGVNDDALGYSVLSIGDMNGDGACWFLVGASHTDRNDGKVYVMSYKDGFKKENSFKFPDSSGGFFGTSLALVGDTDDGVKVAVGVVNQNMVNIYNISGNGTAQLSNSFSNNSWAEFGWSIGVLPDLDGNGVPDLAVGAMSLIWIFLLKL